MEIVVLRQERAAASVKWEADDWLVVSLPVQDWLA